MIELLRREDIVSSAVESGVSHGLHVNQTWFVDWTTVECSADLHVREPLLPSGFSSLKLCPHPSSATVLSPRFASSGFGSAQAERKSREMALLLGDPRPYGAWLQTEQIGLRRYWGHAKAVLEV